MGTPSGLRIFNYDRSPKNAPLVKYVGIMAGRPPNLNAWNREDVLAGCCGRTGLWALSAHPSETQVRIDVSEAQIGLTGWRFHFGGGYREHPVFTQQ